MGGKSINCLDFVHSADQS